MFWTKVTIQWLIDEYNTDKSKATYIALASIIDSCLSYASTLERTNGKIKENEHYSEYLELFSKEEPLFMEVFRSLQSKSRY